MTGDGARSLEARLRASASGFGALEDDHHGSLALVEAVTSWGGFVESVIIISPGNYDQIFRSRLAPLGPLVPAVDGTLAIERAGSRVYVVRDGSGPDEFEPTELAKLTANIENPVFYAVNFHGIELCKAVLEVIADDPSLMLDNDHGTALPGPEFVRRLRDDPRWDWRTDTVHPSSDD